MLGADADVIIVGVGVTFIVKTVVELHPSELVPATVYMVLPFNVRVWFAPIKLPGFQV
jgi:hypothetical protein